MGRTNVVVDDMLVERVKRTYGLRTTREAIDLALHRLVGDVSEDPHAGLLSLRGSGWDGDLADLRRTDPTVQTWVARADEHQ